MANAVEDHLGHGLFSRFGLVSRFITDRRGKAFDRCKPVAFQSRAGRGSNRSGCDRFVRRRQSGNAAVALRHQHRRCRRPRQLRHESNYKQ